MTGFDAIEKTKEVLDNGSLSITGGIYQFSKPLDFDDEEYIEINVLGVPEMILQKANVNINIFVKDIMVGTPHNKRLRELTNEVKALFPVSESGENIHLFVFSTNISKDIDTGRHYSNLRLEVMMLNN